MQVPTQVTNLAVLARASSRLQRLAEPRVRKVTCCYERGFLESVIRPVRQHHPGPRVAGKLGRGEGAGCPVTGGSLHGSSGCAAVPEADVTASWAGEQDVIHLEHELASRRHPQRMADLCLACSCGDEERGAGV